MPNHVMNIVHFDCDEKTMQEILAAIRKDDDGENHQVGDGTIDFNKLVPMPPEYLQTGEWYDWRRMNWGSKWNAYDEEYNGDNSIRFLTAWSPPHPILEELTERFTGVYITHRWAEEEIGVDVGQREYLNGLCVGIVEPETRKESIEMACAIWGGDPLDWGYLPNQAGDGYCNVDREDFDVIELLDQRMLFTNSRLRADEIPSGLYAYHLRHSDDGMRFCSLEPKVIVNHGGTVLTDQPIDFGEKGYIGLKGDTEPNFLSIHRTMGQYLRDEREIALCANSLELADGDLRREEEETETEGMTLA